jgi:hypothetical protein
VFFEATPALYVGLLSLTIGVTHIGFAVVNASLGQIMQAPNAITSVQAAFCMLACGLWCFFRGEAFPEGAWSKIVIFGCCCAYALYQIVQHELFHVATLTERVLYLNMASPSALVIELLVMPSILKPPVTFRSLSALVLLLSGLAIFCVNSWKGIGFEQWVTIIGLSTAFTSVVAKLSERTVLVSVCTSWPVAGLAFAEGLVMTIVTCALSFACEDNLVASWGLFSVRMGSFL